MKEGLRVKHVLALLGFEDSALTAAAGDVFGARSCRFVGLKRSKSPVRTTLVKARGGWGFGIDMALLEYRCFDSDAIVVQ